MWNPPCKKLISCMTIVENFNLLHTCFMTSHLKMESFISLQKIQCSYWFSGVQFPVKVQQKFHQQFSAGHQPPAKNYQQTLTVGAFMNRWKFWVERWQRNLKMSDHIEDIKAASTTNIYSFSWTILHFYFIFYKFY